MRLSIVAVAAAATAVSAQSSTINPAPQASNNPQGVSYIATLPEDKPLRGSVIGRTAKDGKGVEFTISVSGFPAEGGPFMYHIHEKPVPEDGNCTATGAHLDPYKRGEVPPCDPTKQETCQTGDLSGKFRNFTGASDSDKYIDLYSSTNPEDPSFFGDKSIVFHLSDKKRISCANFKLEKGDSPSYSSGVAHPTGIINSTYSVLPTGTGSPTYGSTLAPTFTSGNPTQPAEPTNTQGGSGAGKVAVAGLGMVAGAIALVL